MNLHQLLSQFSHDQLTQLSEEFGVVTMSPSTRNLLQEVRAKYRNPGFVARLISDLPEAHRGFLQTLIFFFTSCGKAIEVPDDLLKTWFGQNPHPLHLFFEKGLLFKKDEALTHTVIIPDDLHERLAAMLRPKKIPLPSLPSTKTTDAEPRVRMLELIFHLLCFLDRRKAPLTQRGQVHRKILELFQKRYPAVHDSEEEFMLSIEFCRYQHLLVEQGYTLKASSVVPDWFQQDPGVMLRDVWRFFLVKHLFLHRMMQQFFLFLSTQCISEEEPPSLYALDACIRTFVTRINASLPEASQFHQAAKRWLGLLDFMGVIELETVDAQEGFRFTTRGKQILRHEHDEPQTFSTDLGRIQPNFDWLVPPTARYLDLWKLNQIAEFVQRDVMTHFRLTQGGILHAMRRGWSQDEIISFLLEHTQSRIPDNVLLSIQEWCEKYGEIQLRRVVLMECQSKALADELVQIETLQPWLTQRIGDRHFVLDENAMRAAANSLQELGYEPAVLKPVGPKEKLN